MNIENISAQDIECVYTKFTAEEIAERHIRVEKIRQIRFKKYFYKGIDYVYLLNSNRAKKLLKYQKILKMCLT